MPQTVAGRPPLECGHGLGDGARGDGVSAARVAVQGDTERLVIVEPVDRSVGVEEHWLLDEAIGVRTRPGHNQGGCEGSGLGVVRHRGESCISALYIQMPRVHTDGEGSGRISEGGAYGK